MLDARIVDTHDKSRSFIVIGIFESETNGRRDGSCACIDHTPRKTGAAHEYVNVAPSDGRFKIGNRVAAYLDSFRELGFLKSIGKRRLHRVAHGGQRKRRNADAKNRRNPLCWSGWCNSANGYLRGRRSERTRFPRGLSKRSTAEKERTQQDGDESQRQALRPALRTVRRSFCLWSISGHIGRFLFRFIPRFYPSARAQSSVDSTCRTLCYRANRRNGGLRSKL